MLKDAYVKPGSWTLGNKQIAESAKKTNYLHLFEKQQSVNSFDWGYSQEKRHKYWRIKLKLPRRANHTTAEAWLWPDGVPGPKRQSSIIFLLLRRLSYILIVGRVLKTCFTCESGLNQFHLSSIFFHPPVRKFSTLKELVVVCCVSRIEFCINWATIFCSGSWIFSRITVESENSPMFFWLKASRKQIKMKSMLEKKIYQ